MTGRIIGLTLLLAVSSWAQGPPPPAPLLAEQPDAQRTQQELSNLLQRYPPALRQILALDSSLLSNQPYLADYPALGSFLRTHPEVARAPSFYIGEPERPRQDNAVERARVWADMFTEVIVFAGFTLGFGLIAWLIRTFIDYRRWNRLNNLQTDVHTRLMDRLTTNEDLLAYIQSPAGSRFLESSPIPLDAGPRSVAAPLGRILWTVQGGVVLMAAGVGLDLVGERVRYEAAQPLRALGILAMALGFGLVVSAVVSFMISRRLGLIGQSNGPATQG